MSDDTNDYVAKATGESEILALISEAEEVTDPLDGLLERAKLDPGAPWAPETKEALKRLRNENRPRFERLLAGMRGIGVRTGELEKDLLRDRPVPTDEEPLHIVDDVAAIVQKLEVFLSPLGEAYADVKVAGHTETYAVDSQGFSDYLVRRHFTDFAEPPGPEALRSAISLARARATAEQTVREVHVRVAEHEGKSFLDLGDDAWCAVEIDAEDWRIVSSPPVRFIRPKGYGPLPYPQGGGSVDLLRKYVNVADDRDFSLIVAWVLAALRATGPYPILCLAGQPGSSKSTLTSLLKRLIDPHAVPLRTMPRDETDLMIAAKHSHLLAIDNISRLANGMSDALCRLSTGAGLAKRRLFSDTDESHLVACRPVIANGIEAFVSRSDLADRALFVELREIGPRARRPSKEVEREFRADMPFILGALLDLTVFGLRRVDTVVVEELPRMADFARFIAACDDQAGTMTNAIKHNKKAIADDILERTPVVVAVLHFMERNDEVRCTATQLLHILQPLVDPVTKTSNGWPRSAGRLSQLVRGQFAPLLRAHGIEISSERGAGRRRERILILRRVSVEQEPKAPGADTSDDEMA